MSSDQKRDYIRAVNCVWDKPSKAPDFSAARNYYDDFVAVYINQTDHIHRTGSFLTWHRLFIHARETALRDECDYQGHLWYWNWFAHQDDLNKSPVFDGSDLSMGGDGEYFAHNGCLGGGRAVSPSSPKVMQKCAHRMSRSSCHPARAVVASSPAHSRSELPASVEAVQGQRPESCLKAKQ